MNCLSAKRKFRDGFLKILLSICAALTAGLLVVIIGTILLRGVGGLTWKLLTSQTSYLANTIGILPNILNTLYMILVAMPTRCGQIRRRLWSTDK